MNFQKYKKYLPFVHTARQKYKNTLKLKKFKNTFIVTIWT